MNFNFFMFSTQIHEAQITFEEFMEVACSGKKNYFSYLLLSLMTHLLGKANNFKDFLKTDLRFQQVNIK